MKSFKQWLGVLSVGLLLQACSHGGGSEGSGSDVQIGRLMPIAVQGLYYETTTQSGITTNNGEFSYKSGETVTFYLGGIALGSSTGAAELTMFNLSGVDANMSTLQMHSNFGIDELDGKNLFINRNTYISAINKMNLLLSLDQDHNPDNGVQLGNLHYRINVGSLDFDQPLLDFHKNFNLKNLIIDNGGRVQPIAGVLTRLYAALNLPASLQAPRTITFDNDGDGTPNEIVHYRYDDTGRLLEIHRDYDGNDVVDAIFTYQYDEFGQVTVYSEDANVDGVPDFSYQISYDEHGNRTLLEIDRNGDGNINARYSYSFDDHDLMIQTQTDNDNDGQQETVSIFDYDTQGLLQAQSIDNGANGTTDSLVSYYYGSDGRKQRIKYDWNNNGTSEANAFYSYDGIGYSTRVGTDINGDGDPEFYNDYVFDTEGRLLSDNQDGNADGVIDRTQTYTYNDFGAVASLRDETFQNGSRVSHMLRTYMYDANGFRDGEDLDSDGNGSIDNRRVLNYEYVEVGYGYLLNYLRSVWINSLPR